MTNPRVDILMYHSISDGAGPTNISADAFAMQMGELAESGLPVISLDTLVQARRGEAELPERSVIITFDDGFQDFADTAWPIMRGHGFTAINFLPTHFLGGVDEFESGDRRIMSVATLRDLRDEGAEFGSHTVTHPHLPNLEEDALYDELRISQQVLQDALGKPIRHIAPPYGAVNAQVNAKISELYDSSVTTQLAFATEADALHALPRIEMFYFTERSFWQGFLSGKSGYLQLRRAIRAAGNLFK